VPYLALSLLFIFPSLGLVYKYFSFSGICVYAAAVFAGVYVFERRLSPFLLKIIPSRQAFWYMAATLALLGILFLAVFPVVNAPVPLRGSDRGEDLNIATQALLHGQYPFSVQTHLGNRITHFPGSLFLAAPFVLLGNGAYQNFFWLALFFVVAGMYLGDRRQALFLVWQVIVFCPAFLHDLVTGGDLIANGIYPLFFIFFLVRALKAGGSAFRGKPFCLAVLLGLAFSSRSHCLFLIPIVFSFLGQNFGFKTAFRSMTVACVSFLAVTLPFFLYDPAGFSPLYGQFNKLHQFHAAWPFFAPALLAIVILTALLLSLQHMPLDCRAFFRNCALVQVPLVLALVFAWALNDAGPHRLIHANYGLFFVFFGIVAFYPQNKLFDKHL
jgi:hypothetical protein